MKKIKRWFDEEIWYLKEKGVRQYVKHPFRRHDELSGCFAPFTTFSYVFLSLFFTSASWYRNNQEGKPYQAISDEERSLQIEQYRQQHVEPYAKELFARVLEKVDVNDNNVLEHEELTDLVFAVGYKEKIYHDTPLRVDYTPARETSFVRDTSGTLTLHLSISHMEEYLHNT